MWSQIWHQVNIPLLYAIPVFLLSLWLEMLALRDERRGHFAGYHAKDAKANIGMGLGSLVSSTLLKLMTLGVYVLLWTYVAPWHIPTHAWWSWVLVVVAVDLAYYANHRFSHRVRLGWAGHQVHHSSEYFNFSTALRQKWNPWWESIVWLPLPLLGFAPWTIYVAIMLNLIYQFFVHTELVDTLPRPIEFVFNTPSHHRVHHGSDPEYLDKNYGGILIIWDRLFGSFTPETHRPTYGVLHPVDSYNIMTLEYHEYGAIVRDVRNARGLRNKLGYIFMPPGWQPKDAALTAPAEVVSLP